MSGDRGNELADMRARAENLQRSNASANIYALAADVLALLSRLDTLKQERDQLWEAIHVKNRDIDAAMADTREAEAQVEALRTALEQIAGRQTQDALTRDVVWLRDRARVALSRVSRSEPAGPGCPRHRGDPHNLCEACWELEPPRSEPAPPNWSGKYAYNSDEWWPAGLPEWIQEQVEAGDEAFIAVDKGLRSFGWPAYNVPLPLPREDSWPGLCLALAQRVRESREPAPPNEHQCEAVSSAAVPEEET